MIAHTLGNPFNVRAVADFCAKHDLWLVEDCCDAVGAEFAGKKVGTFGDLATTSFYPAHHITMGEGGAVLTDSPVLKKVAESFRDWGRDCWCEPGCDNTCGKRFDWQLGDLPHGYDHKYTYSHVGYNLKVTDMQAAVGVSQMRKLPRFVEARRANFAYLRAGLEPFADALLLPEPTPNSNPSWFGFPITVKDAQPGRPRPAGPGARRPQDRHPPSLRRQPAAPAGLPRRQRPRRRRPRQRRSRHESHVLGRRISRHYDGDDGFRRRHGAQDAGGRAAADGRVAAAGDRNEPDPKSGAKKGPGPS